jgi:SAM-dependent methyltransferase
MTTIDWPTWFRENIASDLGRYARDRWTYNLPVWSLIQRHFPAGARILECGSGAGTYSITLSLFGHEIVGVDLDERMVELARENAQAMGANNIRFEVGSIYDLCEHHGRFDLAYSSGVLEHFVFDDVVRILREEARCAPYVLAIVPTHYVWKRESRDFDGYWEPYTITKLRTAFERAGIEVLEQFGYSSANRLGRAVEVLLPPLLSRHVFPHFASTVAVFGRSTNFLKRG